MTSWGTYSISGLLSIKGVVSKVPSSKHFLITFLTVVCGRDLWSNSSASKVGSCYLTVITASILT